MIPAIMCPIEVYYEVDDPRFDGKKLLRTLHPGDDGLGLTCAKTGEAKVVVCNQDDTGGTIMRREIHPEEQDDIRIVPLDRLGVPIERVNARDLRLDCTIPLKGTRSFRMRNQAGKNCIITCTHRSSR